MGLVIAGPHAADTYTHACVISLNLLLGLECEMTEKASGSNACFQSQWHRLWRLWSLSVMRPSRQM